MTVVCLRKLQFLLWAAILGFAQAAAAGTAEVTSADGGRMTFEYSGDKVRMNMQGEDVGEGSAYMVLRDNNIYAVTMSEGQTIVIDAKKAWSTFGNMAGSATPDMAASEVISLKATGAEEQHAGVTGQVYLLRYRNEDGKEREEELVLSDDPRARAFRDAMHQFATTVSQTVEQDQDSASDDMQARLAAMNKGVLRYGKDLTVSALSDAAVDEARFELPAAPMELPDIGSIFGGAAPAGSAGGGQSQSPLSGILGAIGGGEGEAEAGEDGAETGGSATEELGKAFGRLFGK